MNMKSFFRRYSSVEFAVIGLMILQLIVKIIMELKLSTEAIYPVIYVGAVVLTIGWCILIPLCILRIRLAYLFTAIFGFLHIILAIPLPLLKICPHNHLPIAIFVSIHGLLICVFSFIAYHRMKGEKGKENYYFQKEDKEKTTPNSRLHNFMYNILVIATVIRSVWITVMEPFGSRKALKKLGDVGGMQTIVAHSLPYVIYGNVLKCL